MRSFNSSSSFLMAVLVVSAIAGSAHARPTPVGTAFTYQGQLKQGGNNVNATADFEFRLFDVPAGGTIIGSMAPVNAVTITNGLFTVEIDFGAGVFGTEARWLDISVRSPAGSGTFSPLAPRQRLNPTPLAQFALSADGPNLTNLNATNLASGTVADTRLSGNVGMLNNAQTFSGAKTFSAAPSFTAAGSPFSVSNSMLVTNLNADRLDGLDSTAFLQSVPVPLTLSGTSATWIIQGENASSESYATAVYGLASATGGAFTTGVWGQSDSTGGRGVFGWATAASGITNGVWGESASPLGQGVVGIAAATSGNAAGVYGQSNGSPGYGVGGRAVRTSGANYGVWGESMSTTGTGVYGIASSSTGYNFGGLFESNSPDGRGVRGAANATTGLAVGGRFASASTGGIGVWSTANATTGTTYGVYGESSSSSGKGVYGLASGGGGSSYGVHGQASVGWAVYASGNMGASGLKPFRIDHPDDPANKYLLHYSTESPEVLNAYSGTIRLNGAGEAVVELPHYFAKINNDPRYTLTAVGAAMPNLHVADEIDEGAMSAGAMAEPGQVALPCWFRIAGGAPGMKISWEVKAVRNDRWVQQRGAPVEVEKQDLERGTYQHPELYGQPPEKGMNYDAERSERPVVHDPAPQ